MFKLEDLHKIACSKLNLYFTDCTKFESSFNIWKIPFKSKFLQFFINSHETLTCTDSFIAIFWITFTLGLIGFIEACKEMINIFNDEDYVPMTFGHRNYEYINVKCRRLARICGLSLNIKLFFCLLYGLMFHRTHHILPWIIVYGIIIVIEVFYWICDTYMRRRVKFDPIRSLMVLFVRWALTLHIMVVIDRIKSTTVV